MVPLNNNKIINYLLLLLSFIVTLLMFALIINLTLYVINFEKFFYIAYFITFGAVFVFVNFYFVNFSYKNKFLYIIVTILIIIFLSYVLMRL
jgi:hypothetical protein